MIKDIIERQEFIYINDDKLDWVYPDLYNFDPNKFYVLNFSSENWGAEFYKGIIFYLQNKIKNYIILINDVKDHLVEENIFYFPHWYFWSVKNFQNVTLTNKRTNLISCANYNARTHRIYNYLQLTQKSYFDSIYFTMVNDNVSTNRDDEYVLTYEEYEQWNNNKYSKGKKNILHGQLLNAPMFTDSYFNIITETTANSQNRFLSEKTWKAIACEQLFLMLSNPGSVEMLKAHGVDVYDDLIDHKYYDTELDFVARVKKMHCVLDDIVKNDIKNLFDYTKDRRRKNRENFSAMRFGATYIKDIKEYVSSCGISTLVTK